MADLNWWTCDDRTGVFLTWLSVLNVNALSIRASDNFVMFAQASSLVSIYPQICGMIQNKRGGYPDLTKQKEHPAASHIRTMNRRLECTGCGMPMNSIGTWIDGEKYCKDCVKEGKYAGELVAERNRHLKQAAIIELQLEDMGYSEYIKPDYYHYLAQENRAELTGQKRGL